MCGRVDNVDINNQSDGLGGKAGHLGPEARAVGPWWSSHQGVVWALVLSAEAHLAVWSAQGVCDLPFKTKRFFFFFA